MVSTIKARVKNVINRRKKILQFEGYRGREGGIDDIERRRYEESNKCASEYIASVRRGEWRERV